MEDKDIGWERAARKWQLAGSWWEKTAEEVAESGEGQRNLIEVLQPGRGAGTLAGTKGLCLLRTPFDTPALLSV